VIIWRTILSTTTPTLEYLQNTLPFYQNYNAPYYEIRRLLDAIPHNLFRVNYDNLTLSKIQHLPTIISGNEKPIARFSLNLLLLKLLAQETEELPPLFLVDPPPISPQLLKWLSRRYALTKSPLVIFEAQDHCVNAPMIQTGNFILTGGLDETPSPLHKQLTESERHFLNLNSDQVAVRLQSEPTTRFITIF
jgi:hypothetical protein